MRHKSISFVMISFFTLLILFASVTPVNAQPEIERELEIGVYDDYVEIMSYSTSESSSGYNSSELEVRLYTAGGEGPITIELEYFSETEIASGYSENALYFSLTLNKIKEYNDTNGDGVYNPGIDSVAQQVLLGDRGIVMYSNPSASPITVGGKDGYQISVNGTIPKAPDTFYFRLIGYIFTNPVTLDGLAINPTEFKFNLEIENFPFISLEHDLALETILQTEFEVGQDTAEGSSYTSVESESAQGYFGWVNYAMVDGVSKPVTASSSLISGDTYTYLCYKSGVLIIHDPKIAIGTPPGAIPGFDVGMILLLFLFIPLLKMLKTPELTEKSI